MAGRLYKIITPAITLSSSTAAYPLLITTAATTPVKILEAGCSFNGTSATAQQVKVEIIKVTTPSGGTALTEMALDQENARAAVTVGKHTLTSVASDDTTIAAEYVHVQGKLRFNPLIQTTGAENWVIKATPGTTGVTGYFWFVIEE